LDDSITPIIILLTVSQIGIWMYQGPSNALIANAVPSHHRARAFAVSVFMQHALGDAISPSIIGAVSDATSLKFSMSLVPLSLAIGAMIWWMGSCALKEQQGDLAEGKISRQSSGALSVGESNVLYPSAASDLALTLTPASHQVHESYYPINYSSQQPLIHYAPPPAYEQHVFAHT